MPDNKLDETSFSEIKSSATVPTNLEEGNSVAQLQEFDGIEEIPLDDRFSWNPVDWYLGIKKELSEFNLDITEKKRVVRKSISFLFICRCFAQYSERV